MERISSRTVYQNPWMSVREDEVRRDDGVVAAYGVVDKADFVVVLPRSGDGFWLVEQYRYPVARRAWELPQGGWGAGHTGTSSELARAELAEETGLRADALTHLGRLHPAYGFASQAYDVYLAEGLVEGQPNREPEEADMVHGWFSDADIRTMVHDGRMVDGISLSAMLLWSWRSA